MSSPKLYHVYVRPLRKRLKYIFHYDGPDHESLTSQIEGLTRQRNRINASLEGARKESSLLNISRRKDAETISRYETKYRELEDKNRQNASLVPRLNRQLELRTDQLNMLHDELEKTQIQRGKAYKERDTVSDYLQRLKSTGAISYTATRTEKEVSQAFADMKILMPAPMPTLQDAPVTCLVQHRSEAQHQSEMAAIKQMHAEVLKMAKEKHRKAVDDATTKINIGAIRIAGLEKRLQKLESGAQKQAEDVNSPHNDKHAASLVEARHQSEMAAIKEAHAEELRETKAEHKEAMDEAKSKIVELDKDDRAALSAAANQIADLEKKLERLESSVEEQSGDGVESHGDKFAASLPKLKTSDSAAASAVLREAFSRLEDSKRENRDNAAKLAETSFQLQNSERERKKLAAALSQLGTKNSGAALADILAQLEVSWREKKEVMANLLQKISDLEKTSSELKSLEEKKAEVEATLVQKTDELADTLSKLEASGLEKAKVEAALSQTTADLADVSSQLEISEKERTKVDAALNQKIAELKDVGSKLKETTAALEKASLDLKTLQQDSEQREAIVKGLQQQLRDWQDHRCDHNICQQQLNEQKAETREALKAQHEASVAAKKSSDENESLTKELGSLQQEFNSLSSIHNQCKQELGSLQQEFNALSSLHEQCEQGPAEKSALVDDMDVVDPREALEERLQAALREVAQLKVQDEKFLEALRRNRDGTDVDGDSPMDDAEARIRQKLDREFREERGAFSARIQGLEDDIKKKDEKLKSNNVSGRLQDELKATESRASKFEYELRILRNATPSKANAPKTAPAAPNAATNEINQLKRDLGNAKLTAKRHIKDTKAAKEGYERVMVLLDRKDPEASKELRNVEKVRAEMQTEIEQLKKKIQELEAGQREPPAPPASDNPASASGGQGSENKRAREDDEEGEAEGEAKKKLRE